MSEMHEVITIPEGFIVTDLDKLQGKMSEFANMNAAGMHVVFDFDRTLTTKHPGTQDEVTTWHILREHLPEEGKVKYQNLFDRYRALEVSGDMTQQDAVQWWSGILNLFTEHKIDLTAVEETFLERANIRPGTQELFELLASNNIPTVILSAGIRDVIDIWCRKYGIDPTLIVSTALIIDDSNKIIGWQKDTLVHVLNKSETSHGELGAIRDIRPNALLVGDSLDDASMASGDRNVIRVRVLDPRADEIDTENEERRTLEKFDALIKLGSLQPLRKLVELII